MLKISSDKFILRDWKEEDLSVYEYWNTGKHPWMKFDAPYYPKMTTEKLKQAVEQKRKEIATASFPSPRTRLVIAEPIENKLIGIVSWYWQSQETFWKSIGIIIYDDTYWAKSIGSKAWVSRRSSI